MGKIQKTEEQRESKSGYSFPEYTNKELRDLEKVMNEKYFIKRFFDGKENTFYDDQRWQKDNGGLGVNGGIIMTGKLPVQYEINRDKLSKLYKLQGRTDHAKREELKGLEKVAQSMKVVNDTPAVVDDDPLKF